MGVQAVVVEPVVVGAYAEDHPAPGRHAAGLEILRPLPRGAKIPGDEVGELPPTGGRALATQIPEVELMEDDPVQGEGLVGFKRPQVAEYLVRLRDVRVLEAL